MENRITTFIEESRKEREDGAQPIGEILEELFAKYEARFPDISVAVLETPVNAI